MKSNRYRKIFSFVYIYFISLVCAISFVISTFFETSNISINFLWVFIVGFISSYLYISDSKIVIDYMGIYIGKSLYQTNSIVNIEIYDEFVFRMGIQTFLKIHYFVDENKYNEKKVNLSMYNKNVLEKELDDFSQKHNINIIKKEKYKKTKRL
ncbi:hypothetical protein [Tepidibacter aestuarii]|uniref:hypothetical protein n=1 Tax=Tepidibacter aestuarii TaxID=2925782 RepID=UPI0020C154E7|nr:hypothetical protein [Tepidibacter aestuarii]CAH2213865.1 protein of unknown function [Tepidibacter aestuarii]